MTITFLIPESVSDIRDETAPAVCDTGEKTAGSESPERLRPPSLPELEPIERAGCAPLAD
jgi:hypothetical protein